MTKRSDETVAVSGGTGFVGRALTRRLLECGHRVRVLSRRPSTLGIAGSPLLEFSQGDLLSPSTLTAWVEGATVVCHLAGEIHDAGRFRAVNTQGTINVLEASRQAGARRFVFLSSVGVIGADGLGGEVDDTTTPHPRNAYEHSKRAAEDECLRRNRPGFEVSVLRPAVIFGEGKDPARDSFWSLMRMLRDERLVLLGRQYISSYVYVGDVAAACEELARNPLAGGQTLIASEPVPLTEFLAEAAAILGVREPRVLPKVIGVPLVAALRLTGRFGTLYNATRFRPDALDRLGFRRPFGLHEGLRRTLGWYREQGRL